MSQGGKVSSGHCWPVNGVAAAGLHGQSHPLFLLDLQQYAQCRFRVHESGEVPLGACAGCFVDELHAAVPELLHNARDAIYLEA